MDSLIMLDKVLQKPTIEFTGKDTLSSEDLKLQKEIHNLSLEEEMRLNRKYPDRKINERNQRDLIEFKKDPYIWMRMKFTKNIINKNEAKKNEEYLAILEKIMLSRPKDTENNEKIEVPIEKSKKFLDSIKRIEKLKEREKYLVEAIEAENNREGEANNEVEDIVPLPPAPVKNGDDFYVRPPHVEIVPENSANIVELVKEFPEDVKNKEEGHPPEKLVTTSPRFTIDAIKPPTVTKEKLGESEIKKAVIETIKENRLGIKDPSSRVGERSIIIDGKINGWEIYIKFRDENGKLELAEIRPDEYKKPYFASTKGTMKKAERKAYAFLSSLKSHLEKKFGNIESIGMKDKELVLNLKKE